jgi:hypothetical protein
MAVSDPLEGASFLVRSPDGALFAKAYSLRAAAMIDQLHDLTEALEVAHLALSFHPGGDNRTEPQIEQARKVIDNLRYCNRNG